MYIKSQRMHKTKQNTLQNKVIIPTPKSNPFMLDVKLGFAICIKDKVAIGKFHVKLCSNIRRFSVKSKESINILETLGMT